MTTPLVLALAMFVCSSLGAENPPATAVVRGRVVDARTGEPIAKALVSIRSHKIASVTDAGGGFTLSAVPLGPVEITVTTVGYGLDRRTVQAGGEAERLEIRLNQEALRREEEVAVTTAPFEPADPAAPFAHALAGTELENLA